MSASSPRSRTRSQQAQANGQSAGQFYAQANSIQSQIGKITEDQSQLEHVKISGAGGTHLANHAAGAPQLAPNTKRNTAIGVLLGVVLGIGLVFAREAFDTRIRSAEQVASELGLPLFGRLPRPDKDMRKHDQLTLLADPHGIHSEAYKKLRVSLDFANLDPQAQMLLVTSAVAQEGKSTTAANLAVAMAAVGQNVILVDLDLRAPYLDRFFGLSRAPRRDGRRARATPRSTRRSSPSWCPAPPIPARAGTATATRRRARCSTCSSPASRRPTRRSLLASKALATLLTELRERAETVVIDTPPVLPVADTMALTSQADAYMIVSQARPRPPADAARAAARARHGPRARPRGGRDRRRVRVGLRLRRRLRVRRLRGDAGQADPDARESMTRATAAVDQPAD